MTSWRRVRRNLRVRRCEHDFVTFMAADGRIFANEVCRDCGATRPRQPALVALRRS